MNAKCGVRQFEAGDFSVCLEDQRLRTRQEVYQDDARTPFPAIAKRRPRVRREADCRMRQHGRRVRHLFGFWKFQPLRCRGIDHLQRAANRDGNETMVRTRRDVLVDLQRRLTIKEQVRGEFVAKRFAMVRNGHRNCSVAVAVAHGEASHRPAPTRARILQKDGPVESKRRLAQRRCSRRRRAALYDD